MSLLFFRLHHYCKPPSVSLKKMPRVSQPRTRWAVTRLPIVVCFVMIHETDGSAQRFNQFTG
jgi:hypothetical protein